MLKAIIYLLIGFIVLIKSSDIFVDAISSIATHFKMSKMSIALTVAAFGTCAPELAISFKSISSGNGDIALANVIGSNIVNILLIVGLASLLFPIKVKNETIKKELPILLLISSMFVLALTTHFLDGNDIFILNRLDGILFLLFFLIFIFYIISVIRLKRGFFERGDAKYKLLPSIFLTIACCILIVMASDLVVENAKTVASMLNISTKIITMTVVVIGTSLPELTMTVVAAKKGEFDIALGNIIGTNIFNIGIVLGLPLLIYGGFDSSNFNLIDVFVVNAAVVMLYIFSKNDRVIKKYEGLLMLLLFILYYLYLFLV